MLLYFFYKLVLMGSTNKGIHYIVSVHRINGVTYDSDLQYDHHASCQVPYSPRLSDQTKTCTVDG